MDVTTATQDTVVPVPVPTILIVDDSEITARALARVLSAAKFNTAVSYRGVDAVDYAIHNPIAAAVVDIHLPDLSGLVVTQKLREHFGPVLPIIILSGDTSMETLNSLPHVGATYFFSKPVNSSQLVARMKDWVNSPRGGNNETRNSNDSSAELRAGESTTNE
jgi:DNA-binding response OmpR family regulator